MLFRSNVSATGFAVPSTLNVTPNAAGLGPGTYNGTITLSAGVAGPASIVISVVMTVTTPLSPPKISVDTAGLTFAFAKDAAAAVKTLTVTNPAPTALPFTVAAKSTGGWLSVSPSSGSASATSSVPLVVTANPATLSAGTFTGSIVVTPGDGSTPSSIPVTATVNGAVQSILLSQTGFTFQGVAGGGQAASQVLNIANKGQGSYNYTLKTLYAGSASGWLKLSASSGVSDASTPSIVTLTVDSSGLVAGDYHAKVQVVAPTTDTGVQEAVVVLHLTAAAPAPQIQPAALLFRTSVDAGTVASQTVSITNLSSAALTFTSSSATSDGGTYLNYQPTSDTISPGSLTLTVQPDVSSLAAGIYTGAITLSFSDGSTGSIGVTIVVAPSGTSVSKAGREASGCTASQLAVALTSLGSNFSVPASYPTLVSAAVADNCGALLTDGTVRASDRKSTRLNSSH